MTKLSDRLRPGVEAAPWVIEEIKKLEAARLRLFYVRADHDGTGENQDLLVRAVDENEARARWAEYHFNFLGNDDDFDCAAMQEQVQWVGIVPDEPTAGAIPWDTINPTN